MAQNSRFWVTSATPTGDQQASYSGADFADVWRAMGEGVISGHSLPALDGELACSAGGANTVNVADGAAIVDGIYFESTAVENVNVPSAIGEGNTRIDRIVVRVDWASYEAKITRIAGTDAAAPSAPAITQTTETTYDLPLCQVLVDTSGNVTVTDERTFLAPQVDDSTIEVDSNGDLSLTSTVEGKLVTNGDLHNHVGGDGGEIILASLSPALQSLLVTGGNSHDHVGGDGATLPTGAYGNGTVTNAKLADPYDYYLVQAALDSYELVVEDGLFTIPIQDIHNGKSVVKLTAKLATASTSGNVIVRVYNVTDGVTVGTITITATNRFAAQNTITNPVLATNDELRIDITANGTGAKGLIVGIKVDKS